MAIKGRENICLIPGCRRKNHQLRDMQGTVNLMMKRSGGEEVENIGFIDDDKP